MGVWQFRRISRNGPREKPRKAPKKKKKKTGVVVWWIFGWAYFYQNLMQTRSAQPGWYFFAGFLEANFIFTAERSAEGVGVLFIGTYLKIDCHFLENQHFEFSTLSVIFLFTKMQAAFNLNVLVVFMIWTPILNLMSPWFRTGWIRLAECSSEISCK